MFKPVAPFLQAAKGLAAGYRNRGGGSQGCIDTHVCVKKRHFEKADGVRFQRLQYELCGGQAPNVIRLAEEVTVFGGDEVRVALGQSAILCTGDDLAGSHEIVV